MGGVCSSRSAVAGPYDKPPARGKVGDKAKSRDKLPKLSFVATTPANTQTPTPDGNPSITPAQAESAQEAAEVQDHTVALESIPLLHKTVNDFIAEELSKVEWDVPTQSPEQDEWKEKASQWAGGEIKQIYSICLQALWKNWPDALEVALQKLDAMRDEMDERQTEEAEYMSQKLEFTRIRQAWVMSTTTYMDDKDLDVLGRTCEQLKQRIVVLADRQPDDLFSALPGIIPKRDTWMLDSRIAEFIKMVRAYRIQKGQ